MARTGLWVALMLVGCSGPTEPADPSDDVPLVEATAAPSAAGAEGVGTNIGTCAIPPVDPASDTRSRAASRALANEGFTAFQSGDYATAADKFCQAYQRFQAPTLLLHLGRSYQRLGKTDAARAAYKATVGFPKGVQEPFVFTKARSDAQRHLLELSP
jgi:TolA-binding protein